MKENFICGYVVMLNMNLMQTIQSKLVENNLDIILSFMKGNFNVHSLSAICSVQFIVQRGLSRLNIPFLNLGRKTGNLCQFKLKSGIPYTQ